MSDSVQPHRWRPTRLPHPWDSPGKNTGVGCHFLLQCMKVQSESEVTQSCPTLSNPIDCSLPGPSIHGIFQARVLEWGAIAFSEFPSSYVLTVSTKTFLLGMFVIIHSKISSYFPCDFFSDHELNNTFIFSSFLKNSLNRYRTLG